MAIGSFSYTQEISQTRFGSVSFARPADAIAYSIGDAVWGSTTPSANAFILPNMLSDAGQIGKLVQVRITGDNGWANADAKRFRLLFFSGLPTTATVADNAAYVLAAADRALYVGHVDVTMALVGTGGSVIGSVDTSKIAFLNSTNTNLYCVIVTLDAITPAASANLTVTAVVDGGIR